MSGRIVVKIGSQVLCQRSGIFNQPALQFAGPLLIHLTQVLGKGNQVEVRFLAE